MTLGISQDTPPPPNLPLLSLAERKQQCLDQYADFDYKPGVKYCGPVYDTFLCWGPTEAGAMATQQCPRERLSDTTREAFRLCGEAGFWLDKRANETSGIGWTNYTPCFPPEVKILFNMVDDENAQSKFEIAQRTRNLEIVGFSISLIALLISLFILCSFRSLRNTRTKIHMSLFTAMIMQVVFRLILYIDQAFIRSKIDDESTYGTSNLIGIDDMPQFCKVLYSLLEYAATEMFLWMFIEGLYLNNLVTSNVLTEPTSYKIYFITGWTLPLLNTIVWAVFTSMHYQHETVKHCWYGYNFLPIFWIVQGPRLAVIIVNLMFLLNIIRVLVMKLRRTDNSEIAKVRWSRDSHPEFSLGSCATCNNVIPFDSSEAVSRHTNNRRRRERFIYALKAVKAALFLLPLLGITNILDMTEAPLGGPVWIFALWSYITHFLRSFQGLMIAICYCFMNGEVRTVLKKHYDNFWAVRETSQRQSVLFRFIRRQPRTRTTHVKTKSEGTQTKIPLTPLPRHRPLLIGRPLSLADLEISLPTNNESRRSTGTSTGQDINQSRPSSAMSAIGHCVVTIEHDHERPLPLRDIRFRRPDPATTCVYHEEAETSI